MSWGNSELSGKFRYGWKIVNSKMVIFVSLVLWGLFYFGCSDKNRFLDGPQVLVSGHVRNSESAEPLDSVWLTLRDIPDYPLSYSNSDGYFIIGHEGVPPALFKILYGKDGYVTDSADITIPVGQPFVTDVELTLVLI